MPPKPILPCVLLSNNSDPIVIYAIYHWMPTAHKLRQEIISDSVSRVAKIFCKGKSQAKPQPETNFEKFVAASEKDL